MGTLFALAATRVAGIPDSPARTRGPRPTLRKPSPIHDDLAVVINVLPLGGPLVDPHDEMVKVNTQGTMTGLARGTRVGFPGLPDRVRWMRRTNTEYLGNIIQDRPPGMDGVGFSTRVLPLGRGFILVTAEDEAATRRVDAAREDFMANVSHELKTPISVMGILAETIKMISENLRQVTHFVRHLQRESAHLAELVDQIVELSRLQSSDPMLNREVVDMEEIVDEAVGRTRGTAETRRIDLVRAAMPYAQVLGNRWQLIDAVVNLVQNIINYSDDNARVVVAVAQVRDEDDGHVEITMADNGISISREGQGRTLERFYRVGCGRPQKSGDTGPGLSIIRHTAPVHKGSIRVWSRSRRESTPTLQPLARQDGVIDGETQEEREMTGVLIIEDEGFYREALTFILGKEGFYLLCTSPSPRDS